MLDDALRRLCETLLDYPEGIDEARLRARLRLSVWLYDDDAEEAVAKDLAEEVTVFVGNALVIPGRRRIQETSRFRSDSARGTDRSSAKRGGDPASADESQAKG